MSSSSSSSAPSSARVSYGTATIIGTDPAIASALDILPPSPAEMAKAVSFMADARYRAAFARTLRALKRAHTPQQWKVYHAQATELDRLREESTARHREWVQTPGWLDSLSKRHRRRLGMK